MGQCDICGENAGIFKSKHSECEANAESLKGSLRHLVMEGTIAGRSYAELSPQVIAIVQDKRLPVGYFQQTLLQAANDVVSEIAQKAPISEGELTRFIDLLRGFGYPEGNREELLDTNISEWHSQV